MDQAPARLIAQLEPAASYLLQQPRSAHQPKITTYHAQAEHKPRHAEGPFLANLLEVPA